MDEDAYRRRLTASADAVEAWTAGRTDEIEARDLIILEAIDDEVPRGKVATWAKVSPCRVTQIVARRALEAQELEERRAAEAAASSS